jgi:putative Flp pilus-assembly TadE/G-like protein
MSRWNRSDRGAVAIMFALLAVVFMSIAAMGVDLGNAWQEKRQVQSGGDLATEAGAGIKGANLPASGSVHSCTYGTAGALSTDQSVKDIASYLASQSYPDNTGAGYSGLLANLPGQLTDCSMANGEVVYGTPTFSGGAWHVTFNKNQLSLVSPPKTVDFGLAGIMGFHSVNVNGVSTVEIKSPKFSALPFYAFSGCDYGPQTLQQPNNGHSASQVMLYKPSDNANITLTSISPTSYPVDTSGTVTEPLTITGSGFTGVTSIGFFESGNGVDGPAPVTIDNTKFTVNSDTKITIPDLPDQTRGVSGVQEFWYLRVAKSNGTWSKYSVNSDGTVNNAPMLTIGDPPLLCGQGSSSGNFGTLLLSHAGYNGWDAVGAANVALGLTNSLAIYPTGGPADGTCTSSPPSVLWNTDGTNCVDTDTGMSSKVATGGFIGKGSSAPGGNQYLLKPNGKTKCANGGTTEATTVLMNQTINNDTLSCFFLSPNTHVGDVDSASYSGVPLISDAIYDSPRFAYVPVLSVQPANGGSKKYQIIDFRACFVTDQPASAIKGDAPSTTNGLITDNNGIVSVEVIFLNPNALPNPPVKNGTINYTGSGEKIPLLVN